MTLSSRGRWRVVLVPITTGAEDDLPIRALATELDRRLGVTCTLATALRLEPHWSDPERGQYHSNRIVDALVQRFEADRYDMGDTWMLGVTGADIFAADRTFVFGEATLGGCCALVSTARLEGRLDRLVIEAIHEIGHVGGLDHCDSPRCVMTPSSDIAGIDAKSPELCARCAEALGQA